MATVGRLRHAAPAARMPVRGFKPYCPVHDQYFNARRLGDMAGVSEQAVMNCSLSVGARKYREPQTGMILFDKKGAQNILNSFGVKTEL